MKKVLLATLLLTVSLINAAETKLGKAITLKEKTKVSQILSKPANFEGKTVLVEGKVLGVCQEKGCWIEVAGEKKGQKIKVKVNDGEIIFPKDSKGKTALVEGTVEEVKTEMTCSEDMKKDGKAKMDMKECADKAKDAKMDMKECADKGKEAKMDMKECADKAKDAKMDMKKMKKDGKAKMDMKECAEKGKDAKDKKDDCCAGSAKKAYQIKGLGAVIK